MNVVMQQRERRVADIVVRRCQRQVQRTLEVQPVGGGRGRRAQKRGRIGTRSWTALMLLQLGGHQVLLQLLVFVFAGLELLLGTGRLQGLQGAALLVMLAGLTVLDQIITGRRMIEAVAMAIPMAIYGTSVALQCRGGGIGLVIVVVFVV